MLSGYHTTVQIEFRHSRDAPSLSSPLLSLTLTLDPNPTPTQPPFRLLSVSWRRECAAVTRVLVLDSGQQHRQHGRNPPPDDDALSLFRSRSVIPLSVMPRTTAEPIPAHPVLCALATLRPYVLLA